MLGRRESYTSSGKPPWKGNVIPSYALEEFDLEAMTRCSADLRRMGRDASSMAEVAQQVVSYFQESLVGPGGEPACVLSRLFKLHPFRGLPGELQDFVRERSDPGSIRPDLPCMVLLGSRGLEPAWNDPRLSAGHRAISLSDGASVTRVPMFATIINQLAFPVDPVLGAGPETLVGSVDGPYNVFHFAQALGCPAIPAQEQFVIPFGVRSTVGFGSFLPSGSMYLVALFCRVPISSQVAQLFRPLALSTRLALSSFDGGRVFPS
jgi:hypothetical protein